MSIVPYSDSQLVESAARFAETITPAKERWIYCYSRSTFVYESKRSGNVLVPNERTIPVAARLAGVRARRVKLVFARLRFDDYDIARDKANSHRLSFVPDWFAVGPMQAWNVGHIYFARVESHPHVLKIGFSRRVRDRLDDIESRVKTSLVVRPGGICVGTLADEHWWHKNWEKFQIAGEWFFDPRMPDRSLPDFLSEQSIARAA